MTDWTADELARIGRASELRIATARRDGSLRSDLPIWAVRVGERIVIRSWKGTDGAWYRQAQRTGRGRIASGGVTKDVTIADGSALDRAEHDHLFDLARTANPVGIAPRVTHGDTSVRPELQYLLDAITKAPAFIQNNRMDMVAANLLGAAMNSPILTGSSEDANFARHIFLDETSHDFYPDWDRAAWTNVTMLRREAGRNPHDRRLHGLIGELSTRSDVFRELWAAHDVRRHYAGQKQFRPPSSAASSSTTRGSSLTGIPDSP